MTLGDKIAKGKQIDGVAGNSSKETNARARSAKAKTFSEGGGGREAGAGVQDDQTETNQRGKVAEGP